MMLRWFLNLPAFRTIADVDAHCARLGVVKAAGYRAIDGLRVCIEITPDAAMEEVADEAGRIERRAAELEQLAEGMRR